MTAPCTQTERLMAIEKLLNGNGQPGLVPKVAILTEKVENMEDALESLATSYHALVKAQVEHDVTEKVKAKAHEKKYQAVQTASIMLGIVVSLFTIMKAIQVFVG